MEVLAVWKNGMMMMFVAPEMTLPLPQKFLRERGGCGVE